MIAFRDWLTRWHRRPTALRPDPNHGGLRKRRGHWYSFDALLPVFVAWGLLAGALPQTWWQGVEHVEFDVLSALSAPRAQKLPIVIVGIDDISMQQMQQPFPWPYAVHAELVEALNRAGAAVTMFDVLFERAGDPGEARFAEALRAAGNVVIAAATRYQETAHGNYWLRTDPAPALAGAAAAVGLANVLASADQVVRQWPEEDDAMWRQVVRQLALRVPNLGADLEPRPARMIRYLGSAQTFTYVSYHNVLAWAREDDPQLAGLGNALVLVGRASIAASDVGSAQLDLFPTPFTRFDKRLMPGVEIHANLIEGALTETLVDRLPLPWVVLSAVALTVLMQLVTRRAPFPWSLLGAVSVGLALAGFGLWLFAAHQRWLPVAPALALGAMIFVGQLIVSILRERDQQLAIRNTFALYVPGRVVNELVAHPEKISLGGENRELTVLFTDLAGFTTTSETMEPADLAVLLNEYFTTMGDIVFRHGGTIDKFIGDAIMAFWGAPMDDPEHARHGLLAAADMLAALPALNARLAALGLPPVGMRIGLHSGRAVVGNLGSPTRFSYTAMGDTVNLASRLEGANKFFATQLLVSDSTVLAASGDDLPPLRPVGRVQVKGKLQPVLLHTLSMRSAMLAAERAAFAAFEAGDWPLAQAAFRTLLETNPDDRLAQRYLVRLDELLATNEEDPLSTVFVLDEK